MTSCQRVQSLLDGFLALELEPDAEREVRAHVASCAACRGVFVAAEPTLLLSLTPARHQVDDTDTFVTSVLAGVHQARMGRRLRARHSRSHLGLAAAAVLAVTGLVAFRLGVWHPPAAAVAQAPAGAVAAPTPAVEPPFVEVEGQGVRLYQLAATEASGAPVQVALIVDPSLDL